MSVCPLSWNFFRNPFRPLMTLTHSSASCAPKPTSWVMLTGSTIVMLIVVMIVMRIIKAFVKSNAIEAQNEACFGHWTSQRHGPQAYLRAQSVVLLLTGNTRLCDKDHNRRQQNTIVTWWILNSCLRVIAYDVNARAYCRSGRQATCSKQSEMDTVLV